MRLVPIAVFLAALVPAQGQLELAAPFSDHMVLQRDLPIRVFGTAPASTAVTVSIAGAKASCESDANGRFLATLPPLPHGGPHTLNVTAGETIELEDVLIGEVWVCSGQSNMEWELRRHDENQDDIAGADFASIRLLEVPRQASSRPSKTIGGAKWFAASPESVPAFSAVAFYFGRELHRHLDVPIGLIQTAWGGTRAEAWTRRPALEALPAFAATLKQWEDRIAAFPAARRSHTEAIEKWQKARAAAQAAGDRVPRRPAEPMGPEHRHAPSTLFHGMVEPLLPLTIRGVIWYQGESNAGRAHQYRTLFPALIRDWRDAFGQGDFPFLFVQLALFGPRGHPAEWAELRDAQLTALREPNTGMAVTIDIGDPTDIHPNRKDEVGRRLALWAKAKTYGAENLVYSGPLYDRMRIEGARVRLFFDHVGGGLEARGDSLRGFTVADADGEFQPATARIDGDTIVVRHSEIPAPRHVRYSWHAAPDGNLFNSAGLPASPFKTDHLPDVTRDRR